jgi:general L-amino acid transport system permease protein
VTAPGEVGTGGDGVGLVPTSPPEPRRPDDRLAPRAWVRTNLFRTPADGVVTVVAGLVLAWVSWRVGRFVLVTGQWEILERNLTSFLVGRFDRDELWRPSLAITIVALGGGLLSGILAPSTTRRPVDAVRVAVGRTWPVLVLVAVLLHLAGTVGPLLLVLGDLALVFVGRLVGRRLRGTARQVALVGVALVPVAVLGVLSGAGGVPWDRWGGLLLNLLLASCGIAVSFPLGLLLALGRRSELPVVRWLSIAYIELFRGVPLVALILMGALTLQFFVPPALAPGRLVRVIVVLILFTAAYVAEIVRGGLQSVPQGQVEAATAIGLSPARTMGLVVLPQALRASIPALVGQFISLFKDTSLVVVVGLTEMLRVAQVVTQQGSFRGQGLATETLVFAAFIFWVGAYTMSRESQRLERRLGVGER